VVAARQQGKNFNSGTCPKKAAEAATPQFIYIPRSFKLFDLRPWEFTKLSVNPLRLSSVKWHERQ
jgi:hypothetical protein